LPESPLSVEAAAEFRPGDEVFGARDPGHPGIFIKTDEK